jgi:hypothetical protein
MKDLTSYVLCARFMSTAGHLLALLLLVLTYKSNVEVGLSDAASSSDRQDEEDTSLVSAHSVHSFVVAVISLCNPL